MPALPPEFQPMAHFVVIRAGGRRHLCIVADDMPLRAWYIVKFL